MARLHAELSSAQIINILIERDGDICQWPSGCDFDWDDKNHMRTIDHIYPQYLCKQEGWTREEINHIDNLQLMCKYHNTIKGHQLPNEKGEFDIPVREPKVAKGPRPEICETCYAGRLLFPGEVCYDCNGTAQPATMPKVLQRTPKECDHAQFICWACGPLGIIERKAAFQVVIEGPE